jgi:hypothetical protein
VRHKVSATLTPFYLGEAALLAGSGENDAAFLKRNATVQATSLCDVLSLGHEFIEAAALQMPEVITRIRGSYASAPTTSGPPQTNGESAGGGTGSAGPKMLQQILSSVEEMHAEVKAQGKRLSHLEEMRHATTKVQTLSPRLVQEQDEPALLVA